jgi:thiamine kinase-like enzyme
MNMSLNKYAMERLTNHELEIIIKERKELHERINVDFCENNDFPVCIAKLKQASLLDRNVDDIFNSFSSRMKENDIILQFMENVKKG